MPIPEIQHHEDGTPSVLRKPTVYTELFFYQKSDVLVQLTKAFCERFLPKYGDRTVDQMVQAARSIKQNIAEGLTDGQTSFEVELKLLGIAKGSNQELLEDYQDYLKAHSLPNWAEVDRGQSPQYISAQISAMPSIAAESAVVANAAAPAFASRISSNSRMSSMNSAAESTATPNAAVAARYHRMLKFCRKHNNDADYRPYYHQWTDEEMANTAITLCHMVDKAMATFIEKRDREFVEEGGIRERMTAARLDMRGTQKQIIAQQEATICQQAQEIARLRSQVASLQRELAVLKENR